ncbi:uncharacterized protein VTP21DRAFT_7050 [Calcarisporiella thermophila]|uniref:uncharacterized protein n=1 Tax=Calcarisporiella thermophila TaxID=911321 RepID=UPI003744844E
MEVKFEHKTWQLLPTSLSGLFDYTVAVQQKYDVNYENFCLLTKSHWLTPLHGEIRKLGKAARRYYHMMYKGVLVSFQRKVS